MTEVAVVTGASRGIGRATALTLAARGLSVALLGRGGALLEAAAEAARALSPASRAIACDVADEASVDHARDEVLRELGVPILVVNNAGIVHRGAHVRETSSASWDEVIAVNLRGPFLIARAFLPAMLPLRRGRIVQVSSISATLGSPGAASYAASKWGVVGLTKSLAEELRDSGLEAMAVLPGSVDTDMLKGSGFEPKMTADDVARTIVFAGLDAPASMTGSAIELFG
jgi:3-oxoacyl-[acyl-carrier protein] reductase